MAKPLMAKATAVWLVDNTTLSFKQIADFVEMHELEVQGIADGDVAAGVKGFDPIANNQLTQEEIDAAEKDPLHKLKLKFNAAAVGEEKRRGPRRFSSPTAAALNLSLSLCSGSFSAASISSCVSWLLAIGSKPFTPAATSPSAMP